MKVCVCVCLAGPAFAFFTQTICTEFFVYVFVQLSCFGILDSGTTSLSLLNSFKKRTQMHVIICTPIEMHTLENWLKMDRNERISIVFVLITRKYAFIEWNFLRFFKILQSIDR